MTYTLPAYWAPAVINGDYSGLTLDEECEVNDWLNEHIPYDCSASVSSETFFAHRNDANNMGADCAEFTFTIN